METHREIFSWAEKWIDAFVPEAATSSYLA